MPFDEVKLAAMTAKSEEYVGKEEIAEQFGVTKRTVERLIEKFSKRLKKSRRRQGRRIEYRWADVLRCARIHTGIERESVPSVTIRTAYTKQRVKELEAEVERFKNEMDILLSQGGTHVSD